MTVSELIERLKTHDPEARVVVAGYSNGLDGIVEIIPPRRRQPGAVLWINPELCVDDHGGNLRASAFFLS